MKDGGGLFDDGSDGECVSWALRCGLEFEREGADDDGGHQEECAEGDGVTDLGGGAGCWVCCASAGGGGGGA